MGGWTLAWQGLPEDIEAGPAAVTILEGIEEFVPSGTDATHIPTGFTWNPYGEDEFSFEKGERVASAAEDADAVVLVLGEGPYSEGFGNTNTLELPEAQRDLIETAAGTETPVIGVMIAGRPRGTEPAFEPLDAAMMAYQPGTAAGPAIADVLFGARNPSGRLPFTWPRSVGQITNVHNHLPPALFSGISPQEPLFEFGHGLSYTDFEYSELGLSPGSDPGDDHPYGTLEVRVTVHNAGEVAGTDVVQAYNTQAYGSVIYPDEQLVGFERVSLDPGDSERVEIEAPLSTLMVVPGDVAAAPEGLVLEDGKYAVSIGDLTETFVLGSSGYTGWEPPEEEESEEDEEDDE
jgi:beta-glucosidase